MWKVWDSTNYPIYTIDNRINELRFASCENE